MSDSTHEQLAEIQRQLAALPRDELLALAEEVDTLQARLALHGPQTDDELHQWILDNVGIDIPRVKVCDSHDPPFKFFADCYFHRTNSALLMANRGGSKTFLVALLHLVNSKFKRGCESATVGAIEAQARRCYAHMIRCFDQNPTLKEDLARDPMQSETRWRNGSRVEVLPGTMAAVNGPHPNVCHADEVELMDEDVFHESRNMSISGRGIPAQDIITSTRKRGVGLMQRLIDEVNDAKANNFVPPYDMYSWCVFETAECQPNCRVANPDLPEEQKCQCDRVVKGRWENGELRRFSDVCKGRLAKSDGWMPIVDLHKTFMADSRDVWEAQIECIKPSTEGAVLPRFSPEHHGVVRYAPDPENGPIFAGIDFGGTNPHAVVWYQLLRYDVDARGMNGGVLRIREGSLVAFDEFYKSEIGNNKLAEAIVAREAQWRQRYPDFRVVRRFSDPQGKAARLDLAHHSPPVRTSFIVTRDVKEHIKAWVNLIDDEQYFVDVGRCKMHVAEIASWHYPRKKAGMIDDPDIPVNDFDHTLAAARYCLANVLYLEKRMLRKGGEPSTQQAVRMHLGGQPAIVAGDGSIPPVRPYHSDAALGPAIAPGPYVGAMHGDNWRDTIKP